MHPLVALSVGLCAVVAVVVAVVAQGVQVTGALSVASVAQSADHHWQAYKSQHGKTYASGQVEALRMELFLQEKRKIEQFNRERAPAAGFRLALNHMSDWTQAERRRLNGLRMPAESMLLVENSPEANEFLAKYLDNNSNSSEVPEEVDWRKTPGRVSKVKNQGQCGSCWAFSATGALEGQEQVRLGAPLVELSEQNLVDCVAEDNGCSGGLPSDAFKFVKRGIDDEKSYPYEGLDGQRCRFKKATSVIKDTGFAALPRGDEEKLKVMVAKYGPVSVGIDASSDLFQAYSSGVYANPKCSSKELDHGVLVVGYGTHPQQGDYWIVKNSWTANWGLGGYVLMARNRGNMCGIASLATVPTF